jgi:hypothetical protein
MVISSFASQQMNNNLDTGTAIQRYSDTAGAEGDEEGLVVAFVVFRVQPSSWTIPVDLA